MSVQITEIIEEPVSFADLIENRPPLPPQRRGRPRKGKHYVPPSLVEKIINDFLEKDMYMCDISEKYGIGYPRLRNIMKAYLGTEHLQDYKITHRMRNGAHKNGSKVQSSCVVSITCDLLYKKDLNYSEIAAINHVSRERVGQIADQVFKKTGITVARSNHCVRGK